MSDLPLIRLQGVSRRFPSGLIALADTSLSIARNEFVSLLGPSGCGKSTLLRLLAGLDVPSSGAIEFQGAQGPSDNGMPPDIGFVFQEPTLMPWATVRDNVALPLKLRHVATAAIDVAVAPALAAVGLSDFADAVPRELSGGMKMRASIARALITRPSLLLLDEPFAALDEISRFRLNRDVLKLWRPDAGEAAFTGVFVTHSVYEAVFLSQRVVLMSARPGRIVSEIAIDLPYPRDEATRSLPRFTELCVNVSRELHAAAHE